MVRVQKAALWFGLLNVVIGAVGFLGAAVTGNEDGFLNLNPGNLLGFIAINWLHAAIHLGIGVLGVLAGVSIGLSRFWMGITAALFALLAVVGWAVVRFDPGINLVMGVALDVEGNAIHTLWTVIAVFFGIPIGVAARRRRGAVHR